MVPVRAEIVQDSEFSVHGDASDLIDWLRELKPAPQTVFLTHGEEGSATALAARIRAELGFVTVVPKYTEVVSLEPAVGGYEVLTPGIDVEAAPPTPPQGKPAAVGKPVPAPAPAAVPAPAPAAVPAPAPAPAAPRPAPVPAGRVPVAAHAGPPEGQPRYRCLTGEEGPEFDRLVSAALEEGYVLRDGPTVTVDGQRVVLAQVVVWPS